MSVRFNADNESWFKNHAFPVSGSVTVTMWAQRLGVTDADGSSPSRAGLITAYGDLGPGLFTVNSTDGTTFQAFNWETSGSNPAGSRIGSLSMIEGAWCRVALVVSGDSTTFYFGQATGVLESATSSGWDVSGDYSNMFVAVGRDLWGSWFNGRISSIKMWNAALTSTEVEAELNYSRPTRTTNLEGYYPFHTAIGTDFSGQGNDFNGGGVGSATEADPPLRLYLTNAAPTYTPTTKRGGWIATSTVGTPVARKLGREPEGTQATIGITESSATNNRRIEWGRWISEPVTESFSLAGTIDWITGVVESTANVNAFFAAHVFVTAGDTDTVRGTLLSNWPATAIGIEFPISPASAVGRGPGALTLSSVTPEIGDRIVFELGFQARNTVTTNTFGATLNYGNTGATDLTSANSLVTSRPGWIELSDAWKLTAAPVPEPPSTEIELVAATAAHADGVSSVSTTKPTGTAAGDLMVVFHQWSWDATAPGSVLSGWTQWDQQTTQGVDTTSPNVSVYYKVAGSSEPSSYDFVTGTGNNVVMLSAWRGVDTADPLALPFAWQVGGGTASPLDLELASADIPEDGVAWIAMWATQQYEDPPTTAWTVPAGMTEVIQDTDIFNNGLMAWELRDAGDTGTRTAQVNISKSAGRWGSFGLRPASGGPTPTTYEKSGGGAAVLAGAGSDVIDPANIYVDAGGGAGSLAGSAVKVVTSATVRTESGGGAASLAGSGLKSITTATVRIKSGGGAISLSGSGDVSRETPDVYEETGGAAASLSGSGTVQVFPAGTLIDVSSDVLSNGDEGPGRTAVEGQLIVGWTYGDTGVGGVFTAPDDIGAVTVTVSGVFDLNGANKSGWVTFELREDSVLGEGTVLLGPALARSATAGPGTGVLETDVFSYDIASLLTPGADYNIRLLWGATGADFPMAVVNQDIIERSLSVVATGVYERSGGGAIALAGSGDVSRETPDVLVESGGGAGVLAGSGVVEVQHPAVHEVSGGGAIEATGSGDVSRETSTTYERSGGGAASLAGSGSDAVTSATVFDRAGGGAIELAGSGSQLIVSPAALVKAGGGALELAGSGDVSRETPDAHDRSGGGALSLAGSGSSAVVSAVTVAKSGGGAIELAGSGDVSRETSADHAASGGGALSLAGSGSSAVVSATTHEESGGGAATLAGSGAKVIQSGGEFVETGGGALSLAGSGSVEVVTTAHVRSGGGAASLAGSGSKIVLKAVIHSKAGGGAASLAGSGDVSRETSTVFVKAGGGSLVLSGSGWATWGQPTFDVLPVVGGSVPLRGELAFASAVCLPLITTGSAVELVQQQ